MRDNELPWLALVLNQNMLTTKAFWTTKGCRALTLWQANKWQIQIGPIYKCRQPKVEGCWVWYTRYRETTVKWKTGTVESKLWLSALLYCFLWDRHQSLYWNEKYFRIIWHKMKIFTYLEKNLSLLLFTENKNKISRYQMNTFTKSLVISNFIFEKIDEAIIVIVECYSV